MKSQNLETLVNALLAQGQRIIAVKYVHQATDWGLRTSKDYVDARMPDDFSPRNEAPVNYEAFSDAALLSALEYAGRAPHPDLIRACLNRPEALTPALLELLAADYEDSWLDDDPRWYRDVHAGLLLAAFREPAALPIFKEIFSDEEKENLHEWFDFAFPYYYGPRAIPVLADLLEVEGEYEYPGIAACDMLTYIVLHHPKERDRVLALLRSHLPSLDEEGRLQITEEERQNPPEIWTWIVNAFIDLRYEGERAVVKALCDADLIDTMVFGGWKEYQAAFEPDARQPSYVGHEYDIMEDYKSLYQQEQAQMERRAQEAEAALRNLTNQRSKQKTAPDDTFVRQTPKVGRNDPCPCGSGRKYKYCCGKKG
jgi:hypothetical protein